MNEIGVVGSRVMVANLALTMERRGFAVTGHDRLADARPDCFGADTCRRVDGGGTFHTDWSR
jgi:6-phosphogluconate dehydrogenase